VREKISHAVSDPARAPGHSNLPVNIFLDLVEANRRQLLRCGASPPVASKRSRSARRANPTCCSPHRAETGNTGAMMGVAAIRPQPAARRKAMKRLPCAVVLILALALPPIHGRGRRRSGPRRPPRFSHRFFPRRPAPPLKSIRNGQIVFQHGYGVTDLRTKNKSTSRPTSASPRSPSSSQRWPSCYSYTMAKWATTKRSPMSFRNSPRTGKTITIREILNHTSGLLDYEDLMAKQYGNTPDEPDPANQ